eukprot:4043758-Pleurochrysis_carterae.AAC.1
MLLARRAKFSSTTSTAACRAERPQRLSGRIPCKLLATRAGPMASTRSLSERLAQSHACDDFQLCICRTLAQYVWQHHASFSACIR